MTMALAVAMVACEAAAGKPGEAGKAGKAGEAGEPGGVPPSVDEAIGDVSLTASGSMATMNINLGLHFYDPDGDDAALTYEASSSDTDTVTTSVTDSTLSLTAVAVGTAKITVRATDADGLSSGAARFDVTVAETAPPQNTAIPDQTLYQADGAKTIALADHFMHTSTITYWVSSSPVGFVTAEVSEGTLTLTPLVTGQTIVTVTATADEQSVPDDFMVDVIAGSEPTSTPTPTPSDPPQRVGTIMAQEVEVGASLAAMDVSMYFSPTGLTYTAESSDTTKATATIPTGSSSITIAGVAIGTATVTVTATDSDGRMETQAISVTVTAASAPFKPSTVMIAGVTKTRDVSIAEGQTLQSLTEAVVTATRKSGSTTVWTLTGIKKGSAMVRIWNADRTIDKNISVKVENTPPMKDAVPTTILALMSPAGVDKDGKTLGDDDVTSEKRQYHRIVVGFSTIFKDADGAADIDKHMAESNEPYIKVVKALADGVVVDVMKDVGSSFPLVVYVVDKAGTMSEKVTLTAPSPMPNEDVYEVTQIEDDGDFSDAKVWLREGVVHTLTFAAFENDGTDAGFRFVDVFEDEELGDMVVQGTTPVDFPSLPADGLPSATVTSPDAEDNPAYYAVTKTGSLDMVSLTATGTSSVPTLTFKVTGSGHATVTITYHRLVGKDGDDDGTNVDPAERKWISDSETLTMNIVSSS